MRGLMYFFRIGQYIAAVLTCCAIVAMFTKGGLHLIFVIAGLFLFLGWKNEADTIKEELEL